MKKPKIDPSQAPTRFKILSQREVNKDSFIQPWPEAGLSVVDSPFDPAPSLTIENGRVTEMDGRERNDFDILDQFIADQALDLAIANEAMEIPSKQIAR